LRETKLNAAETSFKVVSIEEEKVSAIVEEKEKLSLHTDVKDVQKRVQSIESILKDQREADLERCRVELQKVKEELEEAQGALTNSRKAEQTARDEAVKSKEAERAARESERDMAEQLLAKTRRLGEVERLLVDAEAKVEQIFGEHREAQRVIQQKEAEVRDAVASADAARAAGARAALAPQQAELQQSARESELHARHEEEIAAHLQEKALLETRHADMLMRCQDLERDIEHLQKMQKSQARKEHCVAEREAHVQQREYEIQLKENETLYANQYLADVQQQRADLEHQVAELQRQRLSFEAQREESTAQLERQKKEMLRQAEEQQAKYRKSCSTDKENKQMRQTIQQQKKSLWDLEGQLHKERMVAAFLTPGEYARVAKNYHRENDLPQRCSLLTAQNSNLMHEVDKLTRLNDVLRKYMPEDARQRAAMELDVPNTSAQPSAFAFSSEPAQEPAP